MGRVFAIGLTTLVTAGALVLALDRSGVIAWATFGVGLALLLKLLMKPSGRDPLYALALIVVPALLWVGVRTYVIETWETGEVVELAIDTDQGVHTARLWVLDIGEDPVVYYDADPHVAAALIAGRPLTFTRGDRVSERIPRTRPAEILDAAEATEVFTAMADKYGDRVGAADVYYLMLGRPNDRVAVVARLTEAGGD